MCLGEAYKQVWSRFPGRPWTEVMRDWWVKYPLAWIFVLLFLGTCLGHIFWKDLKVIDRRKHDDSASH